MSGPALERIRVALEQRGSKITRQERGVMAQCPAHEDGRPSLSITETETRARVYCFARCKDVAVLDALGLTVADLYNTPRGHDLATYRYTDAAGVTTRTVHRREGKRFSQSGDTKSTPTLYRLPAVLAAVKAGTTVHLVEGEEDVHALEGLGAVATTAPQGASSFAKVDVSPLAGAEVVVIPDQDNAGARWLTTVRQRLAGVAGDVMVLRPLVGKDVSDHLAAGHDLGDLVDVEDGSPGPRPVRDLNLVRADDVDERPLFERLRCWTGAELARTHFPPLKWVVPGLIPAGLTLLVGAPKVGKSWAALDIALGTAAGDLVLGSLSVEGGRVLYLALEDGPRRLKERQDLLSGTRAASERLHVYCEWPRGTDAARAAWQWCEAHPDVRLVIVDTLARVRPPRGAGNAYDEDTHALVPWQKIAEHFSIAVVIVHHDRKAESGDFVDAVSGTHGLAGVADTTLVLDRARMEDYGRLRLTGRDVQEQEVTLRRAGPAWMVHDGPMPDPDLGGTSGAILAWLKAHQKPAKAAEVADGVGEQDVDKVRRYLGRLVDSGRASKTGRGLYTGGVSSVSSVSSDEEDPQSIGQTRRMRHPLESDRRPIGAA